MLNGFVFCTGSIIALLSGPAHASKGAWEEYDKLVKSSEAISALGPTLFGDTVNLQNGSLGFSVTDVSIPGNNALPVAITRTFGTKTAGGAMRGTLPSTNRKDSPMGDWDIDLPYVGGTFALSQGWINSAAGKSALRCSVANAAEATPKSITVGTNIFAPTSYWHGTRMNLPGRGSQALLVVNAASPRPTGSNAYWITSSFTSVSCLSSVLNGTGEGFIATAADGTRYWFNWMATAYDQELTQQRNSGLGYDHLPRGKIGLYATRVEDRFGNWVTYTYSNASNAPVRLTAINSSDSRQITLAHNANGFVQSVSSQGRTWTYEYATDTLTGVVQPDGSRWSIALNQFQSLLIRYVQGEPGEQWRNCGNPGDVFPRTYIGTITHPSGAVGEFELQINRFTRNGIEPTSNCALGKVSDSNDDTEWYPTAWDAYSLVRKNITGPGLLPATWAYTYNLGNSTDVVGPSDFARYTYGNTFRHDEGKLLRVDQGSSAANILSTETYFYELAQSGMPYPTPLGTSPQVRSDDFAEEYIRPQKQKTIARQGVTFNNSVIFFDGKARSTRVKRNSSLGYSRTDVISYHDHLTKWVLGQVASTTNVDTNVVEQTTTYDPTTALPISSYGPGTGGAGKLQQTLTYNADGTVATAKDGNNNVTTLSGWKRGIPQSIRHPGTPESPAGATESAQVNGSGRIDWVKDENGYKTCYGYDAMGRLSGITYTSETTAGVCDGSAWNTTSLLFEQVAATEYGIPASHWRQTISTGNARKITYFDGMWRPLVTREYDSAKVAGTQRFKRMAYDADGRVSFASYPGTTDALTTGIWNFYDSLGRPTSVTQDSELGPLTSSTQYTGGFQTVTTNPRGQSTTNGYQVYDQPTYDLLRWSAQPEGKVTEVIRHDNLGVPVQVRQRKADWSLQQSRYYVYDGYRQLCKTIEPETGATVMNYDGVGNLIWSAAGHHDLPSTTSCNTNEGYWWGRRVNRSYDPRNRLSALAFPDGRGNQSWGYTPDGLPASINTYNEPGNAGHVVNAYSYNKRRMLVGESVAQPGWYSWGIGYGYDANASLSAQTYPTGLSVSYAPNGLGQATQAGSYVTGVQYYPNGAIKQFTYGNGIAHTMLQNARQLPSHSMDSGGVLHHEYQYDQNANVNYIGDHIQGGGNGSYSRWMTYDNLDRLTSAGSCSFGGDCWHRFTYDALDNLTSWKLGGVKDYATYTYEPGTNRLGLIQNSVGAGIVGLGYDVQGNLANKNGQLYTFDFGNRLRTVEGNRWYRYDGLGRRIINWPTTGAHGDLSQYSQDGKVIHLADYTDAYPAGGLSKDHIYLGGSLVSIVEYRHSDGAQTVKYQHTDALGSPVAVTNQAGTVIDRTNWEPYGAAIGKPNYDGVGYTEHVMDGTTGLTYMQQRYYDPTIGRFLSVDPVTANSGTGGNFNRYWYANSNPYRFTDPDGRIAVVTKLKDGSINVAIPATFKGPAASSANIAQLKSQVNALSGTYKVDGADTKVTFALTDVSKDTPQATRNTITLTDGPTSRGSSFASPRPPRSVRAEINVQDRFVASGAGVHEVLHLAGARDRYDPNTGRSDPAWGANIMNVAPGNLESRNLPDIISNKWNIQRNESGD